MKHARRARTAWNTAAVGVLALVAASGCYDNAELEQFLLDTPMAVSGKEYRVYPPDVISINSLAVKEINTSQQLRPDGIVNLPLLGEVYVAGKTPVEIEEILKERSRKYYQDVDATVVVSGYNSQKFYIFGQVGGAGPKAWTGKDSLLSALGAAQPTTLAWPERIILIRGDSPQEGGQDPTGRDEGYASSGIRKPMTGNPRKKMLFNLYAMIREGDMSNNVMLQPNDIIYVQANPLAKIGLTLQQLLFPVSPVMQTVGLPARAASATSGL